MEVRRVQFKMRRKQLVLAFLLSLQISVPWVSTIGERGSALADVLGHKIRRDPGSFLNAGLGHGLICSICVVVDKQFHLSYNLNEKSQLSLFLGNVLDEVSWAFRTVDWNGDGVPDNVGFKLVKVQEEETRFAETDEPKPAEELLKLFAQNDFRDCCLGVGFTTIPFQNNRVGVSFIPTGESLGGFCDKRQPSAPMKSANVLLISSKGLSGVQLSKRELVKVLLHEIGHAFGVVKHDMDLRECSKSSTKDQFVMWGEDVQGNENSMQSNSLDFSSCSKTYVASLLYSGRSSCLTREKEAFCGNGIIEASEECDCGHEISCNRTPCCGSRRSLHPCRLKRGENGSVLDICSGVVIHNAVNTPIMEAAVANGFEAQFKEVSSLLVWIVIFLSFSTYLF